MKFNLYLFPQFEWGQPSVRASTTTKCIAETTLQSETKIRSLKTKSNIQTYLQDAPNNFHSICAKYNLRNSLKDQTSDYYLKVLQIEKSWDKLQLKDNYCSVSFFITWFFKYCTYASTSRSRIIYLIRNQIQLLELPFCFGFDLGSTTRTVLTSLSCFSYLTIST